MNNGKNEKTDFSGGNILGEPSKFFLKINGSLDQSGQSQA
jgi:hypothetical protein